MKRHFVAAGLVAVAAALVWSTGASAQQANVVQSPGRATARAYEEAPAYTGPNRAMIGTGVMTFGLAYIPAVIVASQSSQDVDRKLYVPVAGPWMNFVNRPDCRTSGIPCDTEKTNKVLLVVDGFFQGVGALTTVIGLLTPENERTVRTASDKPTIHFSPANIGVGGVGAAAFGTF
jgi:hypothetical protein